MSNSKGIVAAPIPFATGSGHRPQPRAFTLVELMAVLAIVGLLAAILFPVFGRARENARRSSCQSNLKQLGLGFLQYAQDNDENLPVGLWPAMASSSQSVGIGWAGPIYPYVKGTGAYACPSDLTRPGTPGLYTVSYGYNRSLVLLQDVNYTAPVARFNQPAKTILLSETTALTTDVTDLQEGGVGGYHSAQTDGWMKSSCPSCANNSGAICAMGWLGDMGAATCTGNDHPWVTKMERQGRHLEGANYLLADGHVKWLNGEKISTGATATNSTDGPSGAGRYAAGTEYGDPRWQATYSTS